MKLKRNVDQHVQLCTWVFPCGVIALDFVKFCNFQLVSHVTQKGFENNDQHHCEAMHLGLCMWIFFSFARVIALDLQ
jgi:hypothetical protein